jgi:hypothetical protein
VGDRAEGNTGENRDNSYNHKELDKSETAPAGSACGLGKETVVDHVAKLRDERKNVKWEREEFFDGINGIFLDRINKIYRMGEGRGWLNDGITKFPKLTEFPMGEFWTGGEARPVTPEHDLRSEGKFSRKT